MKIHVGDFTKPRSGYPALGPRTGYFASLLLICVAISGCAGSSSSNPSNLGITPASDSVRAGETDMFKVEGSSTSTGTWSVTGGAKNGVIDEGGLFQAPNSVPQPSSVSVNYTVGGKSYTHSIQILNPTPIITASLPSILRLLSGTVTINGSKFVPGAIVSVNGQAVPTTFVSSTTLEAVITLSQQAISHLAVTVTNPAPGSSTSTAVDLPVQLQSIAISPSIISGGAVNLGITGITSSDDLGITLDDRPLVLKNATDSSVIATGFLPPWHQGTATVRVFSKSTSTDITVLQLPITQTATTFDAAARFLTQAGFGPRPDLVQHVQQIGFDSFITEQQAIAPQPYATSDPGVITILERSVLGANPLRMRVAWALQSFLTRSGITAQATNFPFEAKMERDATGNFREILTDISSDVSIAQMLTLAGNAAPKDPSQHPNQNYGRELLQLFTIGTSLLNDDGSVQTNPDGSPKAAYDQDTILALSRVFTGWNYGPSVNPGYTFYGVDWSQSLVGNEAQHDKGQKVLFGNMVIPAGQSAEQDRTMALDAIFAHPNVPPFISRILIQRLVKSNPSPDYVKRISTVFKNNGKGVRGDLSAVVRAILLDPEARAGDTQPSPSDGFLQEPYLFETFAMNITGWSSSDAQPSYLPCSLTECIFYPPTVFGFSSPSYQIPGTNINSPEFQLLNDVTIINRSQMLWGMLTGQQGGFRSISTSSWIVNNFSTIPEIVDALNHLAYHGQMSPDQQQLIINYCNQLQATDPLLPAESAIFLALNADNYTVAQ
jgi:uncharacterized protein (DUF1800 family)